MSETYYESAEGIVISFERAMTELKNHGVLNPKSISQFMEDVGYKKTYEAQEVLRWLGH